jgi:hypothetical protein
MGRRGDLSGMIVDFITDGHHQDRYGSGLRRHSALAKLTLLPKRVELVEQSHAEEEGRGEARR